MHQRNFLQSDSWRDFQERSGKKVFTLENGAFAIKLDLPMGKSYLYSPFFEASEALDELREIGKREDAIFVKVEPLEEGVSVANNLKKAKFNKAKKFLQPQRTIILDVNRGDEDLLANMHPKTRYNIKLAQKKGVVVAKSEDKQASFEDFARLLASTAGRDGFTTHPMSYYEEILNIDGVELYLAFGGDALLSAAIIIFHEARATYLHGASSYQHRSLMAPHLMHWQIIQDARARGMRDYDLWGIDEDRWPGVTRFKKGFGGREVSYIGSYDYVLSKFWYFLYFFKNKLIAS